MTWIIIDNGVLDLVRRNGPFPPDVPQHVVVNLNIAAAGISGWIDRILPARGLVSIKTDCHFCGEKEKEVIWCVESEDSVGIITPYGRDRRRAVAPWQRADMTVLRGREDLLCPFRVGLRVLQARRTFRNPGGLSSRPLRTYSSAKLH